MPGQEIDRDKLRAAIREMGDEYVYYVFDEAIELLSQAKLAKLAARYIDPARLRPDTQREGSLLADVKAFEQSSLRGEYYESFDVNSKNCMEKSMGTRAWIAECNRHLDRCVKQARRDNPAEVRQAFEIIFGLLRHIDECLDDIIFFADEGGSWQVGVDWTTVFPAWFECLSKSAEPEAYGRAVVELVDRFERFNRAKHLATARQVATSEQREALREVLRADTATRKA